VEISGSRTTRFRGKVTTSLIFCCFTYIPVNEDHTAVNKVRDSIVNPKRITRVNGSEFSIQDKKKGPFMENYEHRFIHNPKKKISPDGQTILVWKLGAAKTYYTEGQVLYHSK